MKRDSCPPRNVIASLESIGRFRTKVYARAGARKRHPIVRLLALVVWLLTLALSRGELRAEDDPARLYADGRKAERSGRLAQAYLLYSQAAALEPQNQLYQLRRDAVQSRAALESPPKPPDLEASGKPPLEVSLAVFDRFTPKDRAAAREPQPPPELKGAPGRKDFDLRGDSKGLFEQVARAFGLDTVFDGDYQAGPPIRFQLDDVDYKEALRALETVTGSFIVPVSGRLFLVVKDTEQKRREVEPSVAISIPVPQATATQELVEIAQAVRQIFTLEHMAWDSQLNVVVLRDRISRIVPAQAVFHQLLHHRPQVEIELQLIEVDRSSSLAFGLDPPTAFPLLYLGSFWNSKPVIPSAVTKLAVFGGGQTLFGIAVADPTLIARMSRSSANTLLRTEVRALDGLPATLHVGDRFPVLSSGYFGPTNFQGDQAYVPPPSFTFEDLGVNMKVTPRIHGVDDVTLELEIEFKVLTGESLNGIPVISSRKMTSKVRLRQGEYGVIGGMMSSSEARTIRGIAGLSQIPGLGQLIRSNTREQSTNDVLMLVRPTLLNLPPDQFEAPLIYTGADARPVTPL